MRSNVLDKLTSSLTPELLLNDSLHRSSDGQKYPWSTSDEFFTSDKYAGLKLYPNQRLMLKLWNLELDDLTDYEKQTIERWQKGFTNKKYTIGVPLDIYERVKYLKDNGYDHFSTIVSILGRRASKSFLSGREMSLIDAQMLWSGIPDVTSMTEQERLQQDAFYAEDDLAEHYDDDALAQKDSTIYSIVMATTGTQAQETTFTDHYNAVISNKWLQNYLLRATPFEIRFQTIQDRLKTMELLEAGVPLEREFSSMICRPASSTSTSNRGRAVYSYCVAPETPVKAMDSHLVPIGSVSVGDRLVAFQEDAPHKLAVATVQATYHDIVKPSVRLAFSDKSSIVCSADHRFVGLYGQWIAAKDMVVGMQIRYEAGYKYLYRIEDIGEQTLCDITTSTHTYIANSLYSHNCLAPETPVTMEDGSHKAIIDLHIGDKLKGVDEHDVAKPKDTVVLDKWVSRKPVKRITFTDGTSIIATGNHKFVDANGNWVAVDDLHVGDWLQ